MLIVIKEKEKKKLCLRIPTRLFINSITALIAPRYLDKYECKVTARQLFKFFRVIHKCRRRYKKWDLVEVNSTDGDYVRVRI